MNVYETHTIDKPSVINHITEHISSAIGFKEIMYASFELDDPRLITSNEYQTVMDQLQSFTTMLPREEKEKLEDIIGAHTAIFQERAFYLGFLIVFVRMDHKQPYDPLLKYPEIDF